MNGKRLNSITITQMFVLPRIPIIHVLDNESNGVT